MTAGTIELISDIGARVDLCLREDLLSQADALAQGPLGDGSLVRSPQSRRGPARLLGLDDVRRGEERKSESEYAAAEQNPTLHRCPASCSRPRNTDAID